MIASPIHRNWARAQLTCHLQLPNGAISPDTTPRSWYFEVPRACSTLAHWRELVPRIMFDINTGLRLREPSDAAWIDIESFTVLPVLPRMVLTMTGTDPGALPWVNYDKARVWEPAVCYYVDDAGRYDVMSGHDFSELLLYRLLGRGEITVEEFKEFVDRYFAQAETGAGERIYANAEQRYENLVTVRPDMGSYKKAPGTPPFSCWPDARPGMENVPGIPEARLAGDSEDGADASTDTAPISVYLEAVGPSLIQTVAVLRDFAGLGIAAAVKLAESAPAIVAENVARDEAERFVRELTRVGATASLR